MTLRAVFGTEAGQIIFKDQAEGPRESAEGLVDGLLAGLKRARA